MDEASNRVTIKGCPHCGQKAHLNYNYSARTRLYLVFCKCDFCGSTGKVYSSKNNPAEENWMSMACQDAVRAWNTRFDER